MKNTVQEAVAAMKQAGEEIERLRAVNEVLLKACKPALSATTHPVVEPELRAAIAKAESATSHSA